METGTSDAAGSQEAIPRHLATADQTLQIRPQVLSPLAQPIERSEQLAWAVGMQPKQPTAMHSSMYAEDRNDAVREAALWAQPALEGWASKAA